MLFCDVVGSTALGESIDPEAMQGLLARYFERMKGIVESHGGTVEKFIGDAVMAVFGVPVAHEDDALRACRAAVEMRDALPELGVEGRIGVNTGEVLTGTEERLATGDAVNVAARLEQAAEPGEVLIGSETLALVAGCGRGRRGAAARAEGQERAGRRLPARLGPRGAGAFARLALRRPRARAAAARGRLGRALAGRAASSSRWSASRRRQVAARRGGTRPDRGAGRARPLPLLRRGHHVLAGGRGGEAARRRCRADELAATAIRSLLGRERRRRRARTRSPGRSGSCSRSRRRWSSVFDDIQWGEETFLDLVESTALLSSGAPLLLLCMARPELLERRRAGRRRCGWNRCRRRKPMSSIGDAVSEEARERIVRAAGGNPLFVTEMARAGGADGDVEVPPTLRALLARGSTSSTSRSEGARARRGRGRALPPRLCPGARARGDGGDAAPRRARAP